MNRVQAFAKRHYTGILLSIIVLSVSGSLILLAFQNTALSTQASKSEEQIRLLKQIAEDISKDQQKQHDHQDERQACFFNLFVTYTNNTPRRPITQEDADRCRVGDAESPAFFRQNSTQSPSSQPSASSSTQAPVQSRPAASEEPASPSPPATPPTPQPSTGPVKGLLNPITNALRRIL